MTESPAVPAAHAYRRDIDGLRAVAVLSVLFYHLQLRLAPGGFVGVDIFFVISGYLIIGIIDKESAAGRFSFLDFYERRVRRIFPALMTMFAASALAGWLLMFAGDLRAFSMSLVAATLFASNQLFLATIDYFGGSGTAYPLLHTWSLAIEEQFYIFAPPLLILLARHRRALAGWLWAIFAVSLLFSEWLVRRSPEAAFYILPTRAWELLAGGLIAVGAVPPLRSRTLRELVAALGLAMIACAVLGYHETTMRFPGFSALLPTLGTALIIHAGSAGPTCVSRLLGLRPVVFFGLISYSLYLWHWPILSFYELQESANLNHGDKLLIFGASIATAWLSWRVIETPARTLPRSATNRRLVFAAGAALMVGMLVFGGAAIWNGGFAQRFPPEVSRIAALADERYESPMRRQQCFLFGSSSYLDRLDRTACATLSPTRPNVLILGDSHAAHLWHGLAHSYPDVNFLQITAAGCLPLAGGTDSGNCTTLLRDVFEDFLPRHPVDAIIISGRWRIPNIESLVQTLGVLSPHSRTIYVVGPIVEYRGRLPRLLAFAELHHEATLVDAARDREIPAVDQALAARLAALPQLRYVSAYRTLCPEEHCVTRAPDGMPMQWDYGHLTSAGSEWLAQQWRAQQVFEFDGAAKP